MKNYQKLFGLVAVLSMLGLTGCASLGSSARSGQDLSQNIGSTFKGHAFVVGNVTVAPGAQNEDTTSLFADGRALPLTDQAKILKYEMRKYFKKANLADGTKPAYRVNVAITKVISEISGESIGHVGEIRSQVTITTENGRPVVSSFSAGDNGPGMATDDSSCMPLAQRFNVPALAVNLASGLLALQDGKVHTIEMAMYKPYGFIASNEILASPKLHMYLNERWSPMKSWKPDPIAYGTIEKIIGKNLASYGCPLKVVNTCHGCYIWPETRKGLDKVYGLK